MKEVSTSDLILKSYILFKSAKAYNRTCYRKYAILLRIRCINLTQIILRRLSMRIN